MQSVRWAAAFLWLAGTMSVAYGQEKKQDLDAPPDEMATHLVKILRTTNKAQTNRFVPKVYDLKNVNPGDVIRFLRRPAEIEESGWYTYVAPDGKSGKVLFIVPEYQIPYLDKLIPVIDKPGLTTSSGTKELYAPMKHRSVADSAFLQAIAQYASPAAQLVTDVEANALFAYDTPSAITSLLQAAPILDVPTPQVRLDVTVYEVDIQNDGTLGLDFQAWKNGPGRNLFAVGAFAEGEHATVENVTAPPFDTGVATHTLPGHRFSNNGANAAYLYEVPSAYFDALAVKGSATVVAQLSTNVLHSNTATIQAADTILYFAVCDASNPPKDLSTNSVDIAASPKGGYRPVGYALDPGSGNSTNVAKNRTVIGTAATASALGGPQMVAQDTGLFMTVTPTIGPELIDLRIVFRVLNVAGYADNGRPIIIRTTTDTDLKAQSGHEIVMGGMVHETVVNTTRKVPILGSLPVIGYWFGGEIKQSQKKLVVAVVKPTLVNDFVCTTAEDKDLIDLATGKTPIKLPALKPKFSGDPLSLGTAVPPAGLGEAQPQNAEGK